MTENLFFNFIDDSSDSSDSESSTTALDMTNILGLDNTINNSICANENIMDTMYPEIVNYKINYTVKQLLQICEYYNISKNIKLIKANKDEIITNIVLFETNSENYEIVIKRKQMWYYIEELKNDRFMKKFILLWK